MLISCPFFDSVYVFLSKTFFPLVVYHIILNISTILFRKKAQFCMILPDFQGKIASVKGKVGIVVRIALL